MIDENNTSTEHGNRDAESPWDEQDDLSPPEHTNEEVSNNGIRLANFGERRGSTGATRPVTVTESRDSLQSESTSKKPLCDTLKFDLTQPWQRSLLRDLEQIENSMQKEEYETRPRPRQADRILLGHSESGDFLLECEDDISTATDASSTCPTRLQVIHRHQFPMRPRVPSREDSPTPDPAKFYDIRNSSPKGVHEEVSMSFDSKLPSSAPSIPYLKSPKPEADPKNGFHPIPHALPYGRTLSRSSVSAELYRANAFSEEVQPVEASRILVEDEPDFGDPACMCMGYSSLIDLLLFNEPNVRKKKRRTNFWESPPASRRASLNCVQEEEEEDAMDGGLNPFCMPQQPIHQPRDLELHEHRLY